MAADAARAEDLRPRLTKRAWVLLAAGLFAWRPGPVAAGPPLEFDDPDTPGAGRWEIIAASTFEQRGGARTINPLLDVNYGWGERVQLKLKPRLAVVDPSDGAPRAGAGNAQAGVKWRFLDEDRDGLSMSVYPQADLNPPGDSVERGLVEDGHELRLPVQAATKLGKSRVFADAGYNLRQRREDEWVGGVAFERPLSEQLIVAAEIRDAAQADFGAHELFFNVGIRARLLDGWGGLASIGRTLVEPAGTSAAYYSYLGLRRTF